MNAGFIGNLTHLIPSTEQYLTFGNILKVATILGGIAAIIYFNEQLNQRNEPKFKENLNTSKSSPEIKIVTSLALGNDGRNFICMEALNHGDESVFLKVPSFSIMNSTEHIPIIFDSRFHESVPTGELKSGDSRQVLIDLNEIRINNIDLLENVIFTDRIGRKFKGSSKELSDTIESWKKSEDLRKH